MQSKAEILSTLQEIFQELFETEPGDVVPEANLYEDLDIDSIDAVDLVVKLKELTGKKIEPDDFKAVRTVGDVINAVDAMLRG